MRRWFLVLPVFVMVAAAAVPVTRRFALRTAGRALVVNGPREAADIVILAIDADGAGVLEAADLVHGKRAPRVAVFTDPPDVVDQEFMRRGVPNNSATEREIRQLKALGVERVEIIPRAVAGTEDEGVALRSWCDDRAFQSVIVVSTTDHSRRLARVLHRAMRNHRTRVTVQPSRYSDFDPDRWWETRRGVRTGIVELEKLLWDVVRHPLW